MADKRLQQGLQLGLPVLLLSIAACAKSPTMTECPDTTHVLGTACHLAPDGSYYGDAPEIPEDVDDDTADVADEQVNEESGLEPVEVTEIEIVDD
jgi:hypothetical protein